MAHSRGIETGIASFPLRFLPSVFSGDFLLDPALYSVQGDLDALDDLVYHPFYPFTGIYCDHHDESSEPLHPAFALSGGAFRAFDLKEDIQSFLHFDREIDLIAVEIRIRRRVDKTFDRIAEAIISLL